MLENKRVRKLLMLVGIILIIVGSFLFYKYNSFGNYKEADGVVYKTELVKDSYTDKKGNVIDAKYNLYVRYTVDGKKYESVIKNMSGFKERELIIVYYNPKNPKELSQQFNIFLIIGIIILGIFLFGSGIFLKKSSKPNNDKHNVMMTNKNSIKKY